jgi:hypothetical protein
MKELPTAPWIHKRFTPLSALLVSTRFCLVRSPTRPGRSSYVDGYAGWGCRQLATPVQGTGGELTWSS